MTMKPLFLFMTALWWLLLPSHPLKAETVDPSLRQNELLKQLEEIKSKHHHLIGRVESLQGGRIPNLSPKERKTLAQYRETQKLLRFWEPAAGLKEALMARYKSAHATSRVPATLEAEASFLAFEILQEIHRLQKVYKINSFPVVHNFLIMIRYKKRGYCKDWAEDLLKKITSLPREHFTAYWGEAFPGKMLEHNVAVLVPKGAPFEEGLMIDPWRTGSRPFWLPVKEDHFYKWKAWPQFEPN